MRPWSRTMMRSQWRIVLRRWAMTIRVQASCSRLSATCFWLMLSRALVASSRIRIGGFLRIAGLGDECTGDKQTLFLSAGEASAALADHGMQLHGHTAHVLLNRCQPQSLPGIVLGGPGGSDSNIVQQVAREQAAALQTGANLPAKTGFVNLREVVGVVVSAVSRSPAAGGAVCSFRSLTCRR